MSCQRSRENFPRETIPYQYNECRNQLSLRILPLSSTRQEDFFGPALPPTSNGTEWAQLWLMTSFLLDPHLEGFKGAFSSLGIFTRLSASFSFMALSHLENLQSDALRPVLSTRATSRASRPATWPACQSPSIIPTWILYRAHPPRTSATWCWLRASIEYTSIEAEKAILISSS